MKSKSVENIGFSLFIIGTTAAGKTKLSLDMARRFQGQILSADSKQLYKGANIMTAQATQEEQEQVKHHMLDILDITVKDYNRNHFYYESMDVISDIYKRKTFPVIVGGTNYYIETILFNQKIPDQSLIRKQEVKKDEQIEQEIEQALSLPIDEQYDLLKQLDPMIAQKIHQNDQHRVDGYIRQAIEKGKPPSDDMQDHENVPLRNKNSLIFWPRPKSKEKLHTQMRKRIKEMVDLNGMVQTLKIFNEVFPKDISIEVLEKEISQDKGDESASYQKKGIIQSIGYKEFLPFYIYFKQKTYLNLANDTSSNQEKKAATFEQEIQSAMEDEQGNQILNNCTEQLITNTIQYSKRQIQWIHHRIMTNSDSDEIQNRLFVFEFDDYSSENFKEKVLEPAGVVLETYLQQWAQFQEETKLEESEINAFFEKFAQRETIKPHLVKEQDLKEVKSRHVQKGLKEWQSYQCEPCQVTLGGEQEWEKHLNSQRHIRTVHRIENRKKYQKDEKGADDLSLDQNEIKLQQDKEVVNKDKGNEDNLDDEEEEGTNRVLGGK